MAIRRTTVFGPANVFVTIRAFDKLGEANDRPSANMREVFGNDEARQISEGIASCIALLQYRPDLSRLPKARPTDN